MMQYNSIRRDIGHDTTREIKKILGKRDKMVLSLSLTPSLYSIYPCTLGTVRHTAHVTQHTSRVT